MKKFDFRSLRFKVWASVMAFSLAIILLLWLMQIAFINVYYQHMKQDNITSAAGHIATLYGRVQGQELQKQLQSLADDSDLTIHLMDGEGRMLLSFNPTGRDYRTLMEEFANRQQMPPPKQAQLDNIYQAFAQRILEEPDGQAEWDFDDRQGRHMLILGRQIENQSGERALLVVSSPLQPLTETVNLLSRQLIYLSAAIFAMSIIVSALIARQVSRPIARIRDRTRLLAQGRYEPMFEHGKFTEVDELADALNHMAQALQQVETLREELIANVSHDLRTPLSLIRVYAEMIDDLYADHPEKRSASVAVITAECDRLTSLVQDLLDISKLQSGAETLTCTSFDLAGMIEKVLHRFDALQRNGYLFRFAHDGAVDVFADASRVEQVLYNLLNNAVNYTGEDKRVNITITDRSDRARVLVADTGQGIAPEDVERIWDRYYKVDKDHQRPVTGSGLGLSIVKSILDLHGMPCGVDSVIGHGSTFWFELKKAK
jgi:signal transduction histidine kinase